VHPILADRRRLAAYAAAGLPLAAVLAALLAQGPHPFPPGAALGLSGPLALGALGLLLPVWYVCRTVPVGETSLVRLVVTHGVCALFASLAWVYLGAGLARFIDSYAEPVDLRGLYVQHRPTLLAGGVLLYLLSAFLHYTLLAVEATREARQQSLELAVLAREAELKALKAQVHPHFLFNSLNSISALTVSDPTRAREMCILLAEFFRKSLALGERPTVSLEEELEVARTYLAIEGLRLGARLTVDESVDEAGKACRLPPLLLQPLVENAVRHGIATRTEGGVLRLRARSDGRRLRLLVENPFDPDAPARPGVGLGLANVRQRLRALHGDEARLDAERGPDHFRVTLLLPACGGASREP
jgi:signal transduction histidine kinase